MEHYCEPCVEDGIQLAFDDRSEWDMDPGDTWTLEKTMQWVRSIFTFHRDRVTWVKPPEFPFVVRLDSAQTILTLTVSNILTVDIDDMEKSEAALAEFTEPP